MKKTWTLLSLTLTLYGANTFGGTAGAVFEKESPWTGFYVGVNAGYLWTADNQATNLGIPYYANPLFAPNSNLMTASLVRLGTHNIFTSSNGFMGGGQMGYNALILDNIVIGIDADLDAISQPSGTTDFVDTVSTPALVSTHIANISITKQLDYLGLIKGRLGLLLTPSILVYGAGAFAYGGATLSTTYNVTNAQPAFLPMYAHASDHSVLGGWAAGGGAEWSLTPCWSVNAEYIYYSLGPMQTYLNLTQNLATNPVTPFAGASVKSHADFTGNTVRVGINYHFG